MVDKFTFRLGHCPEYDAPCVEKVPTQMLGPRVFVAHSDYAALEAQLAERVDVKPSAPKVTEEQAELLRRLVMPMVAERSREVGDAWDKAYHVLDALTAAQEAGR